MSVSTYGRPLMRPAAASLAGIAFIALGTAAQAADDGGAKIEFLPAPQITSADGANSFKIRGRLWLDFGFFDTRNAQRSFASGTDIRSARLGVDGKLLNDWSYRFEADFAGDKVDLKDAYVAYNGIKGLLLTAGHQRTPNSLERLTSGNYITFLERATPVEAFTNGNDAGGDWKLGFTAAHIEKNWTLTAGIFGQNASVQPTGGADEGYGYHARVTIAPINAPGRLLHLGVSAYLREGGGDGVVRFSDRPELRIDGSRVVDTGAIDTKNYALLAGEAIAALGSGFVQSEYLHTHVNRRVAGNPDLGFDGYYVEAGYFLTGESLAYRNGIVDRVKPLSNFTSGGGTGAFQLAVRYSSTDLNDQDIAGGKAHNITVGANWWANPYLRLSLNWVRFNTERQGITTNGDGFGARIGIDW
jgi:phosphate-selective porin OprO/OprP